MAQQQSKLPRLNFWHLLKGFGGNLEVEFYGDFFRTSLPVVRIAIILGFVLYSLFGILDIWIVPVHHEQVWLIRYAIVCPLLITAFILTFRSIFVRIMQNLMTGISLVAGVGIVVMIAITFDSELGFRFYYAGLMLVLIWIYTLVRLRFTHATAVGWLITISYEIVTIFFNKLLATPDGTILFVNNNFFFLSANVLGMFASFTIEWYMRKNFLLRLEIQKAYNLNQKYLENIKEGLLLIDENHQVLPQYSKYLSSLFELKTLEGLAFAELIYPGRGETDTERQELEHFLKFLFHNKSADLDMIMDLNPFKNKKITIKTGEYVTKEITVNADFIRIFGGANVEYLMIIFEDMTEIVKYEKELQGQKTRYQQEVESVTAILKSGPAIFKDFIAESSLTLNNIRANVANLGAPGVLDQVFREVHSLKGSAKHLDLNFISTIAHSIEDILYQAKNDSAGGPIAVDRIEELIIDLFHEFQNLAAMIDRLKEFSGSDVEVGRLEWKGQLGEFLRSLPPMVESLAKELKKSAHLEIENSLEEFPHLPKLKNPLIHLLRNSIDHGIEDQFERLSKNKAGIGKITLRLRGDAAAFYIEVEDDGNGIDFVRIQAKALEKNLVPSGQAELPKAKLLQLIFTPNFSSKNVVSEISGRGYGLDIVKDATDQLKGKISVNTKPAKGTKIRLTIPRLPAIEEKS